MKARRVVVSAGPDLPPVGSSEDGVASPDRASGPVDAAPIIGRRAELARLREIRDSAFADGFRCALVGGEAGVGKTCLTAAAVAAAESEVAGLSVIRGECVPLGGDGLPYAPIVGLLHDLAARFSEKALLDWAGAGSAELRWLVPEFGPTLDAVDGSLPQMRLRLFETVVGLIEKAARQAPLLIVIEDLHWADDSSRHLIEFLLRTIGAVPVMLIVTYRTDELTRRHPLRPFLAEIGRLPRVDRVEVGPLPADDVEKLIIGLGRPAGQNEPEDPSPSIVTDQVIRAEQLIKTVVRSSGGIPYFAVELARASRSVGADLPDTLRETLLLRVSRVGEECQRLLRLLAVGGNRVEHEVIAAVAEREDLEPILREAVEANLLLTDESGYAFRHALMREVLYDDLLPGERTRMHRSYAVALEQLPAGGSLPASVRSVDLARHWYAARDNTEALRWSVQAARDQHYGFSEALRLYERALELYEVVSEPEQVAGPIVTLLDEAARAAADAGEPERALALLNEALRCTDERTDPLAAADRLSEKSRMLQGLMQPGVFETIDHALALVPRDPPTRRLADIMTMRVGHLLLLKKPEAIGPAIEAISVARQVGAIGLEAHARNTLGSALIVLDLDPERGWAELDRAGAMSPVSAMVQVRHAINYSDSLQQSGRYAEALEVANRGRRDADRFGMERRSGVMLAGNAAEAAITLGQWSRARQLVEWALRLSPPGHHWLHQRRLLGSILLWVDDDRDAAAAICTEIERYSQLATNGPQYFAGLRINQAELALAQGEPGRAWDILTATLDELPWFEIGHVLPTLGILAMAHGRLGRARVPGAESWLREKLIFSPSLPVTQQWSAYIEAELAPSPQGLETAIGRMRASGAPAHLIAYATLRSAAALADERRIEEARQAVGRAREQADRLGLRLLHRWIDEFEQQNELAAGPASGGAAPEVLTPREREVVALVAQGLSNRQIGQRLVISTKTASVHVSNILAKLGVTGRAEAAAWFADRKR